MKNTNVDACIMSTLQIQLKKEQFKRNTLHCIRPDGTETWAKIYPGLELHELAHFAIETQLQIPDAFYGLLIEGYHISDFELPRDQRPKGLQPQHLPIGALQTEHMVNLMQSQFQEFHPQGYIDLLKTILGESDLPFPEALDLNAISSIHEHLQALLIQWKNIKPGEVMELEFQIAQV